MRNLIFISFLLLLFSCKSGSQKKATTTAQSEQDSEWFSIELAETLSDATKEQKPYSTFVKDIEYVPLETSSKSLVGGRRIFETHVVTKKVIVVDMKIFSRKDGRYIGNLLSRGKAANEYLYPTFLAADDEREEFYLVEPDKGVMHIVGYDNRYKEKVDWDSSDNCFFVLGNEYLLVAREQYLDSSLGFDDFQVINIDTKEVLSKRRSSALTNIENLEDCKHVVRFNSGRYLSMGRNIFWRYKDNIRYYDYLTDSLFTIDTNMKVKPIGILDFEKLKITRDQSQIVVSNRSFLTWIIFRIVETSDEILISFYSTRRNPRGGSLYLLTYSKANKTTKITMQEDRVVPRGMMPPSPYLNDFDNGIAFYPNYATQNESAYYNFLTPLQIKELVAEKGESAYTTEKEKAFKAMADTLKDDDNEVVAILHVDW